MLFDEPIQEQPKTIKLIDASAILYSAMYGLFDKTDWVKSPNNENKKTIPYTKFRQGMLGSLLYYKNIGEQPDETVICVDKSPYWRKDFIAYKVQRKKTRDASDTDFKDIHGMLDKFVQEIKENVNWKVIGIPKLEADDVIAILARENAHKAVTIVSADSDLVQLQKYKNVKQWSPITKKWVNPKESPKLDLMNKIIRGDAKDAIPNIYTHSDFYRDKNENGTTSKQKSVTAKLMTEAVKANFDPEVFCDTADMVANFHRNQLLLDFDFIPEDYVTQCLEEYNSYKVPSKMKLQSYLIENRLGVMLDKIFEF